KKGAKRNYSIVANGVTVGENATVGKKKEESAGITLVGAHLDIANGETVADNIIYTGKGE
ncbi:MAG: hypothetical protein IKB35_00970, partial [Clostridia bacterium]|nr:hypothetical protein [Clostridia bacterium]